MKNFTRTNYFPIGFGLLYIFVSLMAIGMLKLQSHIIVGNPKRISQLQSFTLLSDLWSVYMPILIILGFMYIIFGIIVKRNYKFSMIANSILLTLSLIWFLFFNISSYEYTLLSLNKFASAPPIFYYGSILAKIFGIIIGVIILCIPGFLTFRFLKQDRIENQIKP